MVTLLLNERYDYAGAMIQYDQLIYKIGNYHYNWHNTMELFWLLKGEIELNVDGTHFTLMADDLFLINPNVGHASFARNPNSIAMRIYISPDFYQAQGLDLTKGIFKLNSTVARRNPIFAKIRYDLADLILQATAEEPIFLRNATFYALTKHVLTFFTKDTSQNTEIMTEKKKPLLDNAVKYIEKYYAKSLTLEELAKVTNYSTSHLSKLFKAELGVNFYEYLTRCRLQRSLIDLARTEDRVAEISLANGFSDIKSFNSMFKKHFGITPSAYRKQVDPTLMETDKFFKEKMNPVETIEIQQKLEAIIQHRQDAQVDPCATCARVDYEAKYKTLVENIDKLIH